THAEEVLAQGAGDGWKPDVESCSGPWRTFHLQRAIVLQDNVAGSGKSKAIAVQARREEWLEDPPQCRLVHTAPGVGNRDHDEATGINRDPANHRRIGHLSCADLNLDDTRLVHRLGGIVADIQDDLLQLRGLRRNDRRLGRFAHRDFDMGRQRWREQRPRFRDQRLDADGFPPPLATTTECKNLINQIPRRSAPRRIESRLRRNLAFETRCSSAISVWPRMPPKILLKLWAIPLLNVPTISMRRACCRRVSRRERSFSMECRSSACTIVSSAIRSRLNSLAPVIQQARPIAPNPRATV